MRGVSVTARLLFSMDCGSELTFSLQYLASEGPIGDVAGRLVRRTEQPLGGVVPCVAMGGGHKCKKAQESCTRRMWQRLDSLTSPVAQASK